MIRTKPAVLLILDGWGMRTEAADNAIHQAATPCWDQLWSDYPHTTLQTSGLAVGLPEGQMGNSEVGHLNLGSGRVVYQELTRIGQAIRTGEFFANPVLTEAVDTAVTAGTTLHILGLLSPGGVHSHEEHIHAMLRLAAERGARQVAVHAFTDGRDCPPKAAAESLTRLQAQIEQLGIGRVASLVGRFYVMDRDQRWERIQPAYDLLTQGTATCRTSDAQTALAAAYMRDETDEFVTPTAIGAPMPMRDGDVVINMNYRSDRVRQITRALIEPDFAEFPRANWPQLARYVTLTEYHKDFVVPVAYPPERLEDTLGAVLAHHGLRQLRIAETEKYAHVTFFFNGGVEEPNEGETRILVPSPKVRTYDIQPEMSAPEVTDKLVAAIQAGTHDVIICNYANGDMVGHTGDYAAAVQAVEALDTCIGQVVAATQAAGGELLITADHGNAEQMRDPDTDQAHTAHTTNPVPLLYIGQQTTRLRDDAALCDVAPTLLQMLGLPQPAAMTGQTIFH
ncbi:MAG: 2,3-bisphosphoglycerate-independent phosphoglycerate mutase [Pseudomonadota bacterium]